MVRACGTCAGGRNACRALVGKSEGKRPLGRPRHRWEDIIKMDLQTVGLEFVHWTHLALITTSGGLQ